MSRLTSVAKLRTQFTFVFFASIVFCPLGAGYAFSSGGPGGTWPKSWPKELEPLRKQAWTWEHGFGGMSYDIPFANRETFESAWPHIVELKSKGAPITLLRGPRLRVESGKAAGVIIRLPGKNISAGPWSVTRIELVVDGDIVDVNRIRLPGDTPIIDKRFKDRHKKPATDKKPDTDKKPATNKKPATQSRPR